MSTLTVHLTGMSGQIDVEVPEGATVADVREAASFNDNLGIAAGGVRLAREDEGQTPAPERLTTLPPEVKAGSLR